MAGYKGVVGTMWSIPDRSTVELVSEFYERILDGGESGLPDSKNAARCLWQAIRVMERSGRMELEDWVPFIHFGL
jgi:CHAT domain-containing protein